MTISRLPDMYPSMYTSWSPHGGVVKTVPEAVYRAMAHFEPPARKDPYGNPIIANPRWDGVASDPMNIDEPAKDMYAS